MILSASGAVIDRSCRVVIPRGTILRDVSGAGSIRITRPGVVVEFEPGSVLRGSAPGDDPDGFAGTAIRIDGQKNVTIKGAKIEGYKAGVWATGADGLTLDGVDASNNRQQRLKSTPLAEDGADWMSFHHNDKNEALDQYGAAMYIEDSDGVAVHGCTVHHGQNGLILDRVNGAKVYDNDFSFNSGWGLALWRSDRNTITRNAIDFCVRGHVEGVYNRGQDSAGIIMFEQCSGNVIAENSVTHGGDCFFAFAGLEALNGENAPPGFDAKRKGCNDNLLIDNDFSYAPAHGIEMTFSFGNKFIRNRLVENAICGVWGGYSQGTLIAGNTFEGNGGMGYGLERGGVNIEHGSGNRIISNRFINNKCGVHMWWHAHGDFEKKPWGKANYKGVVANVIAGNTFIINDQHPFKNLPPGQELIVLHLRDLRKDPSEPSHFRDTVYAHNSVEITSERGRELRVDPGISLDTSGSVPGYEIPSFEVLGTHKPVGARPELRGRDKIIMTEWGPWDHKAPLVRAKTLAGPERIYQCFNLPSGDLKFSLRADPGVTGGPLPVDDQPGVIEYHIVGRTPGIHPYTLDIRAGEFTDRVKGTIVNASWNITFFPWSKETDPREHLDEWRALAAGPGARTATAASLSLKFGGGGPSTIHLSDDLDKAGLPNDHFGTIATTTLHVPKGRYRLKTTSDDGVRVTADGSVVIERWNWHAPTDDTAELSIDNDRDIQITVEHFEIDGYAVLDFQIEPID